MYIENQLEIFPDIKIYKNTKSKNISLNDVVNWLLYNKSIWFIDVKNDYVHFPVEDSSGSN